MRAAAPALVFQAEAVMPAARRSGMTTPCAPKPAALRTTAPRLRGSVTESSATISGCSPLAAAASRRSSAWAYSYDGMRAARPWWTAPEVIRSSSLRVTSSRLMPRSAASGERLAQAAVALGALGDVHAVDRHALAQRLDDGVAAGDPLGVGAAGAALLRPGRGGLVDACSPPCRPCGTSRSLAFGVGPRPSRPRLTRPPEPAVGLPLPVFLIEPLRCELPAITSFLLPGTTSVRRGCP